MIPEKEFQQQVLDLARLLGWHCYHTWLSVKSAAGFPDLVLAHPQRGVIFAELKRQDRDLTPAQAEWFGVLVAGGAEAYVWRPDDFDAIKQRLQSRVVPSPPASPGFRSPGWGNV